MAPRKKHKRSFGGIRKLPSGRWQANYTAPDGLIYNAPWTFDTAQDAEAWLVGQRRAISIDAWVPPSAQNVRPKTFGEYAVAWLVDRQLKPRTRAHYEQVYDKRLKATFENIALKAITPAAVRAWYTDQGAKHPTIRSHAYGLLRTILANAVQDELIPVNPAHIRGAGNTKRVHKIEPVTLPQLELLVQAMPDKQKVMTLLAAWCGLRFGELTELRQKDIDLKNGIIRVRRGVVRADGKTIIGTPKSDAGIRDVAIPPHLMPAVTKHIREHAQAGGEGLLFPAVAGGHLAPSALYGKASTTIKAGYGFYGAREAAGLTNLRFHDLRHSGAVLAAQTGATLAELMGRLGHSTPAAAMRYQHAAKDRDMEIAKALSALVQEGKT